MQAEFELLETMRVEASGSILLLARHLARISASAQYFGYACDVEGLRVGILAEASKQSQAAAVRLLLARDGAYQFQIKPLPSGRISRLIRARGTVNSGDPLLYHKTTARGIYEQARAGCDPETDVILVNERGEATETSILNIAVLRGDRWVTPKLSCGLLPGTMRAQLLEEGRIVEGVVRMDELAPGESIRCFNAVRGIFDIPFEDILAT